MRFAFRGKLGARPLVAWLCLLLTAGYAQAQWGRFREGRIPPRFAPAAMPDGAFTICRIMYERARIEEMGVGWATDYPYAEINLLTRLSELTRTTISRDDKGQPNTWVVRLTDDALFNCPITLVSDAGTVGFTPEEGERLREYLLKGGFLWADDFWGTAAWAHWEAQIGRVLPRNDYPIVDVQPDDPIFRSQFQVSHMPQITNILFWRSVGGSTTSERGTDSDADALPGHSRPARPDHGRHDPQHRHRGLVGARRGGSRLLPAVLARRVRVRRST